jgi:hypothetical protein
VGQTFRLISSASTWRSRWRDGIFAAFYGGSEPDHHVHWDGKDAYGRTLGAAGFIRWFCLRRRLYGSFPGLTPTRFCRGFPAFGFLAASRRREITLWADWSGSTGRWNAAQSPGGWDFNVHHTYDPQSRRLHFGDGHNRGANELPVIATVAGTGTDGYSEDGGPATQAQLIAPLDIAVGPDGSFYFVDDLRVRRVTPDGIITTVAGNGVYGFSGDGGPAIQAQFDSPVGLL